VVTPRAARGRTALCQDCGWESRPTTAGLAAHALRIHSCHRHRESIARSQRHRERMAEVDRTPKTCRHQHADHRHGTRAMYTLDNCRCLPCSAACTEYERQRKRRHAYGTWNALVDAEPARQHVRALQAAGMGRKRVIAASGISAGSMSALMYGVGDRPPAKRIRPTTAQRILALTLPAIHELAGTVNVPAIGARRRLQALMWRGWSVPRLAALAGVDRQCLDGALRKGNIYARTHVGVTALYDRLWDQRPPETCHRERISAARSRNRAATNGWVAPLAWGRRQDRRPDSHRNREARQGQRTPRRRAHREGSDHTRAPRPETVNRIRDEHLGGAV